MRTARRLTVLSPLLALALAAPAAVADEPAPAPAAARKADPPGLPPPIVRRPGERAPLPMAAPSQAPSAAPAPATGPAPATWPTTAPATGLAPAPSSAPAPSPWPGTAPGAATPPAPATGTAVLEIVKNHNLPLTDGTLALRLDVRFRVEDAPGASYRVWIHFHDNATGQPIRTTRPAFGDAQGALYVVTKPVPHGGGSVEYVAPLGVPYNVFPDPGIGRSTVVDATASLTRVEAGGAETPMGSTATNFRVHGAEAPGAAAPATTFPAPR